MRHLGIVLACLGLSAASCLAASGGKNFYVITHVDVIGAGGNLDASIKLMRDFGAETLMDRGALRFELLQQENRRNHFTIVEVWQSKKAFEAHTAAAHTKQFREKLDPMLGSPFDERLHVPVP